MPYSKTILCLANSRKLQGRCVAGREMGADGLGRWVRPVSKQPGGELSASNRQYEGAIEPSLGDIITIPIIKVQEKSYQSENHIIDETKYWLKSGQATFADMAAAVERDPDKLWINGHNSFHGMNDKIPLDLACLLPSSLRLIEAKNIRLRVQAEQAIFGDNQLKVRAYFAMAEVDYALTVTDPTIQDQCVAAGSGWYDLGDALLCLSLSEPLRGFVYKLVAGIIRQPAT